ITRLVPNGSEAPRNLHSFPTRRSSDLLFEHELQVLERAPLAMAVAQHGEWGVAGAPQDRQRAGGQTGGLAHRLNVGALDAFDLRSEEHTSELQSRGHLVCRLRLEKKKP